MAYTTISQKNDNKIVLSVCCILLSDNTTIMGISGQSASIEPIKIVYL